MYKQCHSLLCDVNTGCNLFHKNPAVSIINDVTSIQLIIVDFLTKFNVVFSKGDDFVFNLILI